MSGASYQSLSTMPTKSVSCPCLGALFIASCSSAAGQSASANQLDLTKSVLHLFQACTSSCTQVALSTALLLHGASRTALAKNRAMHSCLHLIWRARQAGALALAALPGQPTPLTSTAPIAYYKHQKQICTSHFSKPGEESTH